MLKEYLIQLNTEGYKIMEISKVDFTYKNITLPKSNNILFNQSSKLKQGQTLVLNLIEDIPNKK